VSFYAPAMMIAYFFREGIAASFLFSGLFLLLLVLIYYCSFAGHDGSHVRMWQYPMPNYAPILSNKGAEGGFFLGICYLATVLLAGYLGDVVSWAGVDTTSEGMPRGRLFQPRQRTHNAVSLLENFRRGCGGFICPLKVNDEDNADARQAPAFTANRADFKRGSNEADGNWKSYKAKDTEGKVLDEDVDMYQSTCCNAFTASSGGTKITFGVLVDVLTIVSLVGLVVGPIRDRLREINVLYDWFTLLILLGVYLVIWIWYQPYQYGERIDFPAWKYGEKDKEYTGSDNQERYNANNAKIYLRYYDKFHTLYPIFTYVFIAQLGFCIFSSVMWGMHAFEGAQYAQDAGEARYIVKQNLMMESITVVIISAILYIPSMLEYCLLVKGTVKKPSPKANTEKMEKGSENE